ncbi:OadG-related small transporter subunit [Sphaerochaeta globosa]|uniref:Sodium pump decarboxylase gamma subunit n=1 Tax=Sphaerochaeta globosa (strain ATCC BAA-1886 / DSM 22777 / Buddy) TaxID=158189 RepID=F0RUH9_SPHGB|nr:OadG-related small transporter subunit [Sphaerochaeta globosa]ADY12341.1 hypothetical protein SpiBuddy_0508 [Sphaerochaeta globosa str. Buddy]
MDTVFGKSLTLMAQGMVGIFVVILIIFFVLLVLGKSKKVKE